MKAEHSGGNVPVEFRGCSAMQATNGYGFNTDAEQRNTFCARPPSTPHVRGRSRTWGTANAIAGKLFPPSSRFGERLRQRERHD
jgi:hypothetical protein